jgi:hypothetical protein
MKDKEKKSLHPDILKILDTCQVKRAVWLTDGDCLDITGKEITEKKDLYSRPANFFWSITTFKQLLEEHPCDKYFFHIDSEAILTDKNFLKPKEEHISRDKVKGLDDLLITFPESIDAILEDLNTVGKSGDWFQRFNITSGTSKVRDYFRLNDVTRFYEFHCERRPDLKDKEFTFHGTRYKYNPETNICEVKIPGESQLYFRVGDDYYKHVMIPNKHQQREKTFKGRRKGTIIDDHGKEFIRHVPKYEAFCNVPNHVNFQPVIDNCFNVYSPIDHQPDEDLCTMEDCPTIISYIQHIFGFKTAKFKHPKTHEKHEYATWELALDYFQILYKHPAEKLPILCLVSKANNTGKTTLSKLLKLIYGGNVAIVGNQDLAGDFNAHWATKLVVVCDETKIDKQHVVEKVKSLSTADKITMNAKGKDHAEIDCFIKFIFITNNEESFISMSDDDIRYWVIKVPTLKEENPNITDNFLEEIPAFLSFLNNRKLLTEKLNRMWFYPTLLRTEALSKVIENSHSMVKKELKYHLRQMFLDFGCKEIKMTCQAIKENFFKNKESNYIERVLKEEFNAQPVYKYFYGVKKFDSESEAIVFVKTELNLDSDFEALRHIKSKGIVERHSYPRWDWKPGEMGKPAERVMTLVRENGRPYLFKREDFVNENEESEVPAEILDIVDSGSDEKVTGKNVVQPIDDLPF